MPGSPSSTTAAGPSATSSTNACSAASSASLPNRPATGQRVRPPRQRAHAVPSNKLLLGEEAAVRHVDVVEQALDPVALAHRRAARLAHTAAEVGVGCERG